MMLGDCSTPDANREEDQDRSHLQRSWNRCSESGKRPPGRRPTRTCPAPRVHTRVPARGDEEPYPMHSRLEMGTVRPKEGRRRVCASGDREARGDRIRRAREESRVRTSRPRRRQPACASPRARRSTFSSSAVTTRMRIAILPMVWPPTAVNAQKYASVTSSRNATSGRGRQHRQVRHRQSRHPKREIHHCKVDGGKKDVIDRRRRETRHRRR